MRCSLPDQIIAKMIKTVDFSITEIRGGISKQVYKISTKSDIYILYIWLRPNENELTENQTVGSEYLFADGFDYFINNTKYLSDIGVNVPKIFSHGFYEKCNFSYALVEFFEGQSFQDMIDNGGNISSYSYPLIAVMELLAKQKRNYFGSPIDKYPLNIKPEKLAYNFYKEELRIASQLDSEIAYIYGKIISVLDKKYNNISVEEDRLFSLIHGELTPPHIFLLKNGEIGLIDIEALKFFDKEYDWAVIELMYGRKIKLPAEINLSLLEFYKICLQIGYLSVAVDFLHNVDDKNTFFKSVKEANQRKLLKYSN